VNARECEALGAAVSVVAQAVRKGIVTDEPRAVVIHGNNLHVRELQWLLEGFGAYETQLLSGPRDESVEVRGVLLGRLYRVLLCPERHEGKLRLTPAPERRPVR
jgi:hypothetical protein